MTDGAGRALTFVVTSGQLGDMRPAHGLLAGLPPPEKPLADAAYDSNGLYQLPMATTYEGGFSDAVAM